ncbi:hypothetical protein D3C80_513730 [compost metagenome]
MLRPLQQPAGLQARRAAATQWLACCFHHYPLLRRHRRQRELRGSRGACVQRRARRRPSMRSRSSLNRHVSCNLRAPDHSLEAADHLPEDAAYCPSGKSAPAPGATYAAMHARHRRPDARKVNRMSDRSRRHRPASAWQAHAASQALRRECRNPWPCRACAGCSSPRRYCASDRAACRWW